MPRSTLRCAKWCGAGCTQRMYEAAQKRAAQMIRALGKGWRAEVFENCGWHAAVRSDAGHVTVYDGFPHRVAYSAFISYEPNDSGGRYVGHGATPQAAVDEARALFVADFDRISAAATAVAKGTAHAPSNPAKKDRHRTQTGSSRRRPPTPRRDRRP